MTSVTNEDQQQEHAKVSWAIQLKPIVRLQTQSIEKESLKDLSETGPLSRPHGDRMDLPQSCLSSLMDAFQSHRRGQQSWTHSSHQSLSDLPSPLTFSITYASNGNHRKVHAGLREFTAPEGRVLLSTWLCDSLGLPNGQSGEEIKLTIRFVSLPKATFASLRPLMDPDWQNTAVDIRSLLEASLRRNFTTLTEGETLPVVTPTQTYRFLVGKVLPESEARAVSIIDTEMAVDIESLQDAKQKTIVAAVNEPACLEYQGIPLTLEKSLVPSVYWFQKVNMSKIDSSCKIVFELEGLGPQDDADILISSSTTRPSWLNHERYGVDYHKNIVFFEWKPEERPINAAAPAGFIYFSVQSSKESRVKLIIRPFNPTVDQPRSPLLNQSVEQPSPEHELCPNCRAWIPKSASVMHSAFCLRNNVRCDRCGLVMKKEEADRHWHCEQCDFITSVPAAREKHSTRKHVLLDCVCGMQLYLNDIAEHAYMDCPDRIIMCRYCHILVPAGPRSFVAKDLLIGGQLTQHESECGSRTLVCQQCSKPVAIKDVQVHMKLHEMNKQSTPLPFHVCRNVLCSGKATTTNDMGLCQLCFGPFYIPELDQDGTKRLTRLVHHYFSQLTKGCGRNYCLNMFCKTSAAFRVDKEDDANEMAVLSMQLANTAATTKESVYLCVANERLQNTRFMAAQLSEMGYHLAFCIKALEETRLRARETAERRKKPGASTMHEDSSSDEEDSVGMDVVHQEWISHATDWLLNNAPKQ